MSEWIYLSHFYNKTMPGYGGKNSYSREETKCLHKGDTCNQFNFSMSNHHGTHIDLPSHFHEVGQKLEDYPANFWHMKKIFCLDVKLEKSELLKSQHIKNLPQDIECLLIRTGFEEKRSEKVYWEENPGLSEELGFYLKEKHPNLKVIGFDFISATAYQQRPEGKKAHLAFLGKEKGNPILIIEDMKLSGITAGVLKEIIIAPLLLEGADGVPVTVIAK